MLLRDDAQAQKSTEEAKTEIGTNKGKWSENRTREWKSVGKAGILIMWMRYGRLASYLGKKIGGQSNGSGGRGCLWL